MSDRDELSPSELARRLASRPRRKRYERTCGMCGKEFLAAREEAKYCSDRCRWTAANRARSERTFGERKNDDASQD